MRIHTRILNSLLLPATLLSVMSSCGGHEEKKPAAAEAPHVTEVFLLNKDSLSSSIRIPGELIAFQQVDLYAKVSSFIKKLNADVGSEVSEGQVLAILEAPELSAQLAGAQSRLKSQEAVYMASKASYERILEASKTPGTVSKNDLDQADAKQKSDLAQLDAAKASFHEITDVRNYLEIRAPFNGVITARNVSSGAYVGPSGKGSDLPIFTLQQEKKLRLVLNVPESYTAYLDHANEVPFMVKALSGQRFKAKISRASGALDSKLRSQRVELDVENSNKRLLPGMIAEVSIPLKSSANAFIVPATAVLNSTLGVYVIRVHDGRTVWIPVTSGRSDYGKTEVFGPLQEKDTLVQNATEEVRNGDPVQGLKLKH